MHGYFINVLRKSFDFFCCRNTPVESKALFPHFSCEKLSVQYGHKQCLGFIDHLKQGRPCFAFVQFFHEFSNAQGNIPTRMQVFYIYRDKLR